MDPIIGCTFARKDPNGFVKQALTNICSTCAEVITGLIWNLSLHPSLFPFQTSRPSNYLLKLKKFKGDIECRQQFFELWKLSANSLVAQDLPHPFNRNG